MPISGQANLGNFSNLGVRVVRAPAALPAAGAGTLFRVHGGRCKVFLLGRFTAAADATITNLTIRNTATTGANTDLATATAITSQPLNAQALLPAAPGALTLAAGTTGLPVQGQVVNPGTIDAVTSANNAAARVAWTLFYEPLDAGAYVSAA